MGDKGLVALDDWCRSKCILFVHLLDTEIHFNISGLIDFLKEQTCKLNVTNVEILWLNFLTNKC